VNAIDDGGLIRARGIEFDFEASRAKIHRTILYTGEVAHAFFQCSGTIRAVHAGDAKVLRCHIYNLAESAKNMLVPFIFCNGFLRQ
jgi:hypothetical protein